MNTLDIHITKNRDAFPLDIKFSAPLGLTVLFGPSGSGKTTVVNAIAGIDKRCHGKISVGPHTLMDSRNNLFIPAHRRKIGYIFQDARLFPHMSVQKNLTYAERFWSSKIQSHEFERVVTLLGISHLLARAPSTLSGGEKQRVAIGRALLSRPRILLADEPLAALDQERKEELLPYFERLRDAGDIPIIYVTHSVTELARLATHVVSLKDGKVAREGDAHSILSNPSFAPKSVRSVGAIIDATIFAHHDDGLTELLAADTPLFLPEISGKIGKTLRVRISAQDVILSTDPPSNLSALNRLFGEITHIHEGSGPGVIVTVTTAAGPILARITKRSMSAMDLEIGNHVYAIIKSLAVAPGNIGQ